MLFVALHHINSIPNPKIMDALQMARLDLNIREQAIEIATLSPASNTKFQGKIDIRCL